MIKELWRLWWGFRDVYPLRERVARTPEVLLRTAAHRMPRKLAYWVLIDQIVRHVGNDVVPEVPAMTILQRADKG